MTEPTRKAHSLEELHAAALSFMQTEYGRVSQEDQDARSLWHERLGLLVVFTHFLWELPPNGDGNGS